MALIRQFVCDKLKISEQSDDSLEEQTKKYQEIFDIILKAVKSLSSEVLVDCLKSFIEAILRENVNLEISKQLLPNFCEKLSKMSDDISKPVSIFILDKVQPRDSSLEKQVVLVRQHLAEIYERNQNWREAANVLVGIQLESGNKRYTTDYKLQTYLKLTNFYLSANEVTEATECIKKASLLQAKSRNDDLRTGYQLCDARVLDHQGEFIEAAKRYLELSNETIIDGIEPLRSALICTVLAPAGKKKVWILKKLFKDQRCQKLPGYSVLKKMHLGEMIRHSELNELENSLHSHQKALATIIEDTTVLDLAVIEQNLLSASKSYKSIPLEELSILLDTSLVKVKKIAGQMILEGRMNGNIDEGNSTIQFDKNKTDENDSPATCQGQPAFEEKDQQKNFKPGTKYRSDVWNGFDLDPTDSNFAICAECNARIERLSGNTKKMRCHFQSRHKDLDLKTYQKQNKASTACETTSENNHFKKGVGNDRSTGRKRGRSEDNEDQCSQKIRKRSLEKEIEEHTVLDVEEMPRLNDVGKTRDFDSSSMVSIETPAFSEESEIELSDDDRDDQQQPINIEKAVWKSVIRWENIVEFAITAREVNGSKTCNLMDKLPSSVNIVGRISKDTTCEYFAKVKETDSSELIVLKLEPACEEDKIYYATLHTYLKNKSSLAVVDNGLPVGVKDLYLMPFSDEVPPVLQSIVGGGIDETWSNVLLGIMVRIKDSSSQEVVTIDKEKVCSEKEGLLNDSSHVEASNKGTFPVASAPQLSSVKSKATCNPEMEVIETERKENRIIAESSQILIEEKNLDEERNARLREASSSRQSEAQKLKEEMFSLKNTFDVGKTRNFDTSSMVIVETPEYSEGSEIEMTNDEIQPFNKQQTIWKAFVRMKNVAEFSMTAQEVTGSKTFDLMDKLPNSVNVVGRVKCEDVWKYIEEVEKIDSTKLIALKMEPAYEKDRVSYSTLHTHLSTRSRLGVVNGLPVGVKDLYLMPVSGEVPPVLQSIVGRAVDESCSNVLLAIIVCRNSSTQKVVTGDKEKRACSEKDSAVNGVESLTSDSFCAEPSNDGTFVNASAPQVSSEKSTETCNPEIEVITTEGIGKPQGQFIEAAGKYHELPEETNNDKTSELLTLTNSLLCTLLASAGGQKKEMLKVLFEDEQYQMLPGYSILKLMYQGKMIRPSEWKDLEDLLQPHHKSSTGELGFSILGRVVVEHNLLLISKLYENITFEELGTSLKISPAKAEMIASQMLAGGQLSGRVDKEKSILYFEEVEQKSKNRESFDNVTNQESTETVARSHYNGNKNNNFGPNAPLPIRTPELNKESGSELSNNMDFSTSSLLASNSQNNSATLNRSYPATSTPIDLFRNCNIEEEDERIMRREQKSGEVTSLREPRATKFAECENKTKKSIRTMILEILDYGKPEKLGVFDREIEKNKRLATKQDIVFRGGKSWKILKSLRPTLQRALNLRVNFSIVDVKENGCVVLRIEEMSDKLKILRKRDILNSYGLDIWNYFTDRDTLIYRWLKKKERELKVIGVEAKSVSMGIFINKYKWVWDEDKGKLIETKMMDKF